MKRAFKTLALKIPPVRDYVARMHGQLRLTERKIELLAGEIEALGGKNATLERQVGDLHGELALARTELITTSKELGELRHRMLAESERIAAQTHRRLSYTYQDGDAIRDGTLLVPVSADPEFRSVFLFSFVKSGSVLVNAIASEIFQERGIAFLDIPGHLFEKGIDPETFQCDLGRVFPTRGYCFGGFREIPRALVGSEVLRQARKIVVTRDPRDILVSLYFSVKFSHPYPGESTPQFSDRIEPLRKDAELAIDDFCLAYAWTLNAVLRGLRCVLDDKQRARVALRGFHL